MFKTSIKQMYHSNYTHTNKCMYVCMYETTNLHKEIILPKESNICNLHYDYFFRLKLAHIKLAKKKKGRQLYVATDTTIGVASF